MKLLIYSDNHFCKSSSIISGRGEKYSTRLENQIKTINWVESLFKTNNCDVMVHLGDFFDKSVLDAEEISALKDINWDIDTQRYFIVGNHEMGNQDLSYNSTNALSEYGYICNKPTLISDDSYNIILIPYILESDRKPLKDYIEDAFNDCEKDTINRNLPIIVLTHNDIKGINYAGFESKAGFDLNEINKECVLFLDGHLHNSTMIDLLDSRIYLVGNLTGQNFSEDAYKYKHCAYILDTDDSNLRLLEFENPYAFNFYKLEVSESNILDLNNVKSNAVVSVKTNQKLLEKVKDIIYNNPNIIKSRITLVLDVNNTSTSREEILTKDHIQQYKEYILEHLGCDDIVKDELRRL